MAAAVTSGVVAAALGAVKSIDSKAIVTPNAMRAILQFTAVNMPREDRLSQGAGSLNPLGVVRLAAVINTRLPVGSWWLRYPVLAADQIGGETVLWSQRIVWGDRIVWGARIVWGDSTTSIVYSERIVWGDRIVWGEVNLSGLVWGKVDTDLTRSTANNTLQQ